MKDTLLYIVQSIVDFPDDVTLDEQEEEGVVQFSLSVNKEDMGKVIGKEGKVIRSIRNVMKIQAMKQNKRINISLVESA
ncbi:MAG: KH domain-containing protein [Candidatus Levybacteria bacterium]|nr:KH domain-containing protein [Candidatus Levybacteria bacterium]